MWINLIIILSMALHPAEKYAQDVAKGKIVTGQLMKLTVERYYRDIKNAKKKGWYFDREAAISAIDFCPMQRHYKGELAGQPFVLLPHQQFQWWNIYGWKKKDGTNRFRTSYEEVARKNGKSTGSAARGNLRIFVTEPNGAQVYCAATKENQAHIITNDAGSLVMGAPYLKNLVETKKMREHIIRVITKEDPVSYIRSIGRDSKSEDGRHASEIKIDEYHAWDSNYLLEVLQESTKGRLNPLTDITTTAGLPYTGGKDGVCFAFRKVCVDILHRIKEDDSLFIMIHSMDDGDDWEDERNWIKANPSLGAPGCVTLEDLRIDYVKAKNEGAGKLQSFLTKSLNLWTDAPKVWVQDKLWQAGDKKVQVPESLKGFSICKPEYLTEDYRKWFFGYDGGRTYDFSAWVGISEPDEKGFHDIIPFYWIPEETLVQREKEDRTTYRDWREKGHLITTPGNAISKEDIKNHIIEVHNNLDICLTHYDPALFAGEMMTSLTDELGSDKFVPYSQAIWTSNGKGMSPPTKQLEGLIMNKKLRHGGHPVLRWNCRNSVIKIDANENIKIMKDNPKQRVDGMVALVMGVAAYDAYSKGEYQSTEWGMTTINL